MDVLGAGSLLCQAAAAGFLKGRPLQPYSPPCVAHSLSSTTKQLQQQRPRRRGIPCAAQSTAANRARSRRPENATGEFFVDHTCIDCDTCRWMTPEVFSRRGDMSAVHRQPVGSEERARALQALLACPTASIHTEHPPRDIQQVQRMFPLPVDEANLPGVYHCGYHSEKSYGATPYLIVREDGNVLVDSPRYTEVLAKRLDELGGVNYIFLTHRDDVADHEKWAARYQAERIIHREEMSGSTRTAETPLEGDGPWHLGPDIDLVFTPGHTSGCVSLLYKPQKALFTGDHLCWSQRLEGLSIMRGVNWYSVPVQLASVEALLPLDFVWLLPGHGRRYKFESVEEKNEMLRELLERER